MRIHSPLHPFLLCLYLVLRLVAGNLDETSLDEAWRALVALPLFAALLLVGLRPLVGSYSVAGLVVSALLLLMFSFEAAWDALVNLDLGWGQNVIFWVLVGTILLLMFAISTLILRNKTRSIRIVPMLNVMTAVLLLFPVTEMALYVIRSDGQLLTGDSRNASPSSQSAKPIPLDPGGEPLRDIYFIVLDGYARADVLHEVYGHDNSGFVAALRERGFYVAERSASNYISTKLVLPSMLNLRYLDYLVRRYGKKYRNVMPLYRNIRRNRVVSWLRSAGYRIVNIRSVIDYTALADPDEMIVWHGAQPGLNDFESALLGMTPLLKLVDRARAEGKTSPGSIWRQKILFALEELARQGGRPGPKFVYAHIMSPHDPFVFGPNGEERFIQMRLFETYGEEQTNALSRGYGDQVQYLNGRLLEALDRILKKSQRAPIIVMMGDHGLRLQLRPLARDTCLQESFAILNTLYLPDRDVPWLRDTISPVNTFRTIFDAYFSAGMGQLPDRHFFAHRRGYYNHVEVTDVVETCLPGVER